MSACSRLLPVLLPALLAIAPLPSEAHEFWLAPSRWVAHPGDTVAIGALAGEGFAGARKPLAPEAVVRFTAHVARVLDLRPVAGDGDTIWARFAPADAGGLQVAYVSGFTPITLEAAAFDRYLAEEGLEAPLAARRARRDTTAGRERYRRCATLWLAGDGTRRAVEPLGLPCEIVPLETPGAASRLRVRVLYSGRPLAGARLTAWRQPFAADGSPRDPARRAPVEVAWSGRTDARGEAEVPVAAAGEWLLGVVHMVPSADPATADWESTWASLAFARRPPRR